MVGFSLTLFSLFSVLEIVQEMEIVQTVTLWKERRVIARVAEAVYEESDNCNK